MASLFIEGIPAEEFAELPADELRSLVFTKKPLVFRIGSATVLGEFSIHEDALQIELAHIDGGGEGVLPTIAAVAKHVAQRQNLSAIEWLVYATNCAHPNLKLRRVLQRRRFVVTTRPGKGECYFFRDEIVPATNGEL